MPPDVRGMVIKYLPNRSRLANKVVKSLDEVFRVRRLPEDLVRLVVRKAFELEREFDNDVDSHLFDEKLKAHVVMLKPRFHQKIAQGGNRVK